MRDYSAPYSSNREDKVRITLASLIYSAIFIILTFIVIASINPPKQNPEAIKSAQVLNIVQSNIKSGFREPLIYDLEFIVPALKEHGFIMADYYAAERYFKSHGKLIKYKNGYYYAARVRK